MPVPQARIAPGGLLQSPVANTLKGAAAGLLGFPGDVLSLMETAQAGQSFQRPKGLFDPFTSDALAQRFGADLSRPSGMVGLIGAPDPGDVARLGGKGLLAMTLFHGTPHKFAKFDISKIGSGEGAQAFGHGLYFAENRGVARSYAANVGSPNIAFNHPAYEGKHVLFRGEEVIGTFDDAEDARKAMAKIPEGHLYEVDIPDETIGKMLDWDAPLSEQPESVRKGIMKAYEGLDYTPRPDDTGAELYDALTGNLGFDDANLNRAHTSKALNEAGIPGIRFFDGNSRNAGEGTRNIVVFNPDDITSVKRDGELVFENKSGLKPASVDKVAGDLKGLL